MTRDALDRLRADIQEIDRKIFALLAERSALALRVGRAKVEAGWPIRNYQVEAEVLQRARELTRDTALSKEFVETVVDAMIRESVAVQSELLNQANRGVDAGARRCLVVGGAGKMGGWMVGFLRSSGHAVEVVDPAAADPAARMGLPDLAGFDVVAVCVPLAAVPSVLEAVLAQHPPGLVFDIASLKSHLVRPLRDAAARGLCVASCHPLFGPDAKTLGGRNVILCGAGNAEADARLRGLFADTAAHLDAIPVEDHDRYMALSLGLAHAVNLLFGDCLARAGVPFHGLLNFAGTTFMNQVRTTRDLFAESPELYHAIQNLNDHRDDLYRSLGEALARLTEAGRDPDPARLRGLMEEGRAYFRSE